MNFTLHEDFTINEDAWSGDERGRPYDRVIGYRVGGMPDGKTARIANFGGPGWNNWRIMRINPDETQSDWTGNYESFEDALAALRQDYQ